jgi:hypothetical protein
LLKARDCLEDQHLDAGDDAGDVQPGHRVALDGDEKVSRIELCKRGNGRGYMSTRGSLGLAIRVAAAAAAEEVECSGQGGRRPRRGITARFQAMRRLSF